MIFPIVLISIVILLAGYRFYGHFLSSRMSLDDSNKTPACKINDGLDFVPARSTFLLGQHFSAIAAAGPIVGPILACIWFGWLPAILWILIGAIFIGGVHDFSSLVGSIRHKASSIGEIVKQYMSPRAHLLFLIFVWLALVYVIIAFTDITANTFKVTAGDMAFGQVVAATSIIYLALAIIKGIVLYKFKLKLWLSTLIFLPLILFSIWASQFIPEEMLSFLGKISVKEWDVILLLYCFIASVIPVWLLLQPRGYLGGWLLYIVIIFGLIGAIFGNFSIQYPALNIECFRSLTNGKLIFPILFITVACGACSGFHGIVSSGTTSKQLSKEKDALPIGFGAMLLEALVAVLALTTVLILPKASDTLKMDPNIIYANGIARFLGLIGIDFKVAFLFALLAFSTFVYDTLDVCTRLARYIFQEITGWHSKAGGIFSSLISLALPFFFLIFSKEKAYLLAWPIFGTSNQLLASLTLLAISMWLINKNKRFPFYTIIPMLFMLVMTVWSLINMTAPFLSSLILILKGTGVKVDIIISGVCSIVLLALSLMLVKEAIASLIVRRSKD